MVIVRHVGPKLAEHQTVDVWSNVVLMLAHCLPHNQAYPALSPDFWVRSDSFIQLGLLYCLLRVCLSHKSQPLVLMSCLHINLILHIFHREYAL